jgi:hypothetical protein
MQTAHDALPFMVGPTQCTDSIKTLGTATEKVAFNRIGQVLLSRERFSNTNTKSPSIAMQQ